MAIITQKRILNLIPKTSAPVTIHVSQGNVGETIEFTLVKGDELFTATSNLTATVHGVRSDGANFGPYTCTLNESKVSFTLRTAMAAISGAAVAEIVLVNANNRRVGSSNFAILVEDSAFPVGVTYSNDTSVYEAILTYVQGAVASMNTDLTDEISARTNADSALNTRIDEIIAPSGEAPNPAEITDARIGVDNVTYPNLGTAIRTQVSDLKRALQLYGESTFVKTSDTHSADNDRAPCNIKSGEEFVIQLDRPTTNWVYFYGYDAQGTRTQNYLLDTNQKTGFFTVTAPSALKSIGLTDPSSNTGTYTFYVYKKDSAIPVATKALNIASKVSDDSYAVSISKNLIGAEPNRLYPCDIAKGTVLTVSTASGENITTGNTYIEFYTGSKELINRWNLFNGNAYRTFTYDRDATAKYVAFTGLQYPLQLEVGSAKTAYQVYFANAKELTKTNSDGLFDYTLSTADILKGTLVNGVPDDNNASRIYSRQFIVKSGDYISFNNEFDEKLRYLIAMYNDDGSFDSQTDWKTVSHIFTTDKIIRIVVGTSDYSTIDSASYESVANTTTLHLSIDNQFRGLMDSPAYVAPVSDPDHDTKTQEYASTYLGVGNATSFVFFTDPHVLSAGTKAAFYEKLYKYTGLIGEYYNKLATSFVICGGDWLEWQDTPTMALWKLNLMTGRMKELFGDRYYPIFGNHDNNYQGTQTLSKDIVRDVMFPYWEHAYYTFKTPEARFYIMDSGTDYDTSMTADSDRWVQIAWLANQLIENDDQHSAVCTHILWNTTSDTSITPFADNIQKLIGAYNGHTSITLNGMTYDFSGCTGKVGFVLGGHIHQDKYDTTNYAVPVIARLNTQSGNGSFDLAIADWTHGKLKMIRVGSGSNSTFDIIV